jgi:hypothetical protein
MLILIYSAQFNKGTTKITEFRTILQRESLIQGLINIGPVIGLHEMRLCMERGPRYNPQVCEGHLIKVYFHKYTDLGRGRLHLAVLHIPNGTY